MKTIREKEALLLYHRQEVDRLQKEIDAEKLSVFTHMLHKAYYGEHSKTYFFVDSICKSKFCPFGVSLSYSEITCEFMIKPQEFKEIPLENFFLALDEFVVRKKKEIRLELR